MPSSAYSLLWFLAIVAVIPLALWLLKRTPLGGAGAGQLMRTVAALPISPSQRRLTVEVGSGEDKRWLVLGVSPQSITTLYMMLPDPAAAPPAEAAARAPFAQLLRSLGPRPGDDGAR